MFLFEYLFITAAQFGYFWKMSIRIREKLNCCYLID